MVLVIWHRELTSEMAAFPTEKKKKREYYCVCRVEFTVNHAFLDEVPRRDAAMEATAHNTAPRETVQVTSLGHATVNHSLNFISPQTVVHRNAIENLWKCCKDKFKRMHGTS